MEQTELKDNTIKHNKILNYYVLEKSNDTIDDIIPYTSDPLTIEFADYEIDLAKTYGKIYNKLIDINADIYDDTDVEQDQFFATKKSDKYKPKKTPWTLHNPRTVINDLKKSLNNLKFKANKKLLNRKIKELKRSISKLNEDVNELGKKEMLIQNESENSSITSLSSFQTTFPSKKEDYLKKIKQTEKEIEDVKTMNEERDLLCQFGNCGIQFVEKIVSNYNSSMEDQLNKENGNISEEHKNYANSVMTIFGEILGMEIEGDVVEWKEKEWGVFYCSLWKKGVTMEQFYQLYNFFFGKEK